MVQSFLKKDLYVQTEDEDSLNRTLIPLTSIEENIAEASSLIELLQQSTSSQQKLETDGEIQRHGLDNPKAQISFTEKGGTNLKVMAQEKIDKGELIAVFDGTILQADNISELPTKFIQDHVVQVGGKEYLNSEVGIAPYLNHSCNPNCGIVDGKKIVAMRAIAEGEELTWDYESTEDSDWEMTNCECGSENCRGRIRAFKYMPIKQKQKLKGYISPWLIEKYKDQVEFKSIQANEITDEDIEELGDFIRWVFCNSPEWEEYAYCPNCDPADEHGKRISIREALDLKNGQNASLEQINDKQNLPNCNECGTKLELFMDPDQTFRTLFEKLKNSDEAYYTTMRNGLGEIVGVTYAFIDTLKRVFEKEWGHVYSYADKKTRPNITRDYKNFKMRFSNALPKENMFNTVPGDNISDDAKVVCGNLIAIHPDFQGKGYYSQLATQTCLSADATRLFKHYILAESVKKTKAHQLLLRGGAIEIPGVLTETEKTDELEENDYLIVAYQVEKYMQEFFRAMME